MALGRYTPPRFTSSRYFARWFGGATRATAGADRATTAADSASSIVTRLVTERATTTGDAATGVVTHNPATTQTATTSSDSASGVVTHRPSVTERGTTASDSGSGIVSATNSASQRATTSGDSAAAGSMLANSGSDRGTTAGDSATAAVTRNVSASDRGTTAGDAASGIITATNATTQRATTGGDAGSGAFTRPVTASDRATTTGDSGTSSALKNASASDRSTTTGDAATSIAAHYSASTERGTTTGDAGTAQTAHLAATTQRATTAADSASGAAAHFTSATDRATTSADTTGAAYTRVASATQRATTASDSASASYLFRASAIEESVIRNVVPWFPRGFRRQSLGRWTASTTTVSTVGDTGTGIFSFSASASQRATTIADSFRAQFQLRRFANDGNPHAGPAPWMPRGFVQRCIRRWQGSATRVFDRRSWFPRGFDQWLGARRWRGSMPAPSVTDRPGAVFALQSSVSEAIAVSDYATAIWSLSAVAYEDAPSGRTDSASSSILTTNSATEPAIGAYARSPFLGAFGASDLAQWNGARFVGVVDGPVFNVLQMVGTAGEQPPGLGWAWFPRGFGRQDGAATQWLRTGTQFRPSLVGAAPYPWYPRGFGAVDKAAVQWAHGGPAPYAPNERDRPQNVLHMVGIVGERAVTIGESTTVKTSTYTDSASETMGPITDTPATTIGSYQLAATQRATTSLDTAAITQFTPGTVYAPPIPSLESTIPDALVTVYTPKMDRILAMDVAPSDMHGGTITYEDTPEGCGSATLTLGLYPEEMLNRGYWTAENIVEISTGDCVLAADAPEGAAKLYVDSNAPFATSLGEDFQQAYARESSMQLAALMNVIDIGTDTNGQYIVVNQPRDFNGHSYAMPAMSAGTVIGRRRYVGRIKQRSRANVRDRKASISLVGLATTFGEANADFTIANTDVGSALFSCISQFASRWPFLQLIPTNFPSVGMTYTGSREASMLDSMVAEILSAVTNGDRWVLRIGHDRIPRLIKLYSRTGDSYTYNQVLPQGVYEFEPLNLSVTDEDTSNFYNCIKVIGDTDAQTKQAASAIVVDSTSIALYGRQIDGTPVTNTACKTTADCARYGQTLLDQNSIASSNNTFRVYTRNDHRNMRNMPGGIRQGDVIRGVQNVVVTRSNSNGTGRNMVPDSEFNYVGAVWQPATISGAATPTQAAGPNGGNALIAKAAGPNAKNRIASKQWVDLAPGQWYTLSVWVDASLAVSGTVDNSGVPAGSPGIILTDASSGAVIAAALQTPGVIGVVYASFQAPDGVFQATVTLSSNGAYAPTAPNTVTLAQPMLTKGNRYIGYEVNQATPPVYGLVASVTSTIDMSSSPTGLDRWQDLRFASIEPDWSATMAERNNASTTAILANRATGTHLESFCVSPEAFPASWTADSLVIHVPSFAALFEQGSSAKILGNAYVTLRENSTQYIWVNPDGTFEVNLDRTTVPGAILYAIAQTSAFGVLGFSNKASIGITGVGAAALATSAFAAPVFQSDPVITSAPTPYPTDANVEVLATLRDIPLGALSLVMLYREHVDTGLPPNAWIPHGEIALDGAPKPTTPQTIDYTYAQLGKGRVYDFAVQYRGAIAYGLISGNIGPANTRTNGFVAQSIIVTSQYLATSGAAYVPIISAPQINVIKSPDNINAAIQVSFAVTNQRTDGSLKKIRLWARPSTATTFLDCGAVAARGLGTTSPPASASYTMTAILPIGQGYTFAASAEDIQGRESDPSAAIISSIIAADVVLDPSQLSQSLRHILNSNFGGLEYSDDGFLALPPPATEIAPSQQLFSLSLTSPGNAVTADYPAATAVTFTARYKAPVVANTTVGFALVFFADCNGNENTFANGLMLQVNADAIGVFRKINGAYTNYGYFIQGSGFNSALTPLDGNWHTLKASVSSTVVDASGDNTTSYVVTSGRAEITLYFDGVFLGRGHVDMGATTLSGRCGPRSYNGVPGVEVDDPVLIDRTQFGITVGASSVSYGELDPLVKGILKNPTDVSAGSSALASGIVGADQALPSAGNNLLYNPSGARGLQGWSVYGPDVIWQSSPQYGGSIRGYLPSRSTRIDQVLQQLVTRGIFAQTAYTASGRVRVSNVLGTISVDCYDGTNVLGSRSFTAPGDYSFEFTFATKSATSLYFRLHYTGVQGDAYFYALQLEPGNAATLFNDDATPGVSALTQQPNGGIDLTNGYNTNYNLDTIPNGASYGKIGIGNINGAARPLINFADGHANQTFDYVYGTVTYSKMDPASVGRAMNAAGTITGVNSILYQTGSTVDMTFTIADVQSDQAAGRTLRIPPGTTYSPSLGVKYPSDLFLTIPAIGENAYYFISFALRIYGTNVNTTATIINSIGDLVETQGQASTFANQFQSEQPTDHAFATYKMYCGSSATGKLFVSANTPQTILIQVWIDCFNEIDGFGRLVKNTQNQTRVQAGDWEITASRYA